MSRVGKSGLRKGDGHELGEHKSTEEEDDAKDEINTGDHDCGK